MMKCFCCVILENGAVVVVLLFVYGFDETLYRYRNDIEGIQNSEMQGNFHSAEFCRFLDVRQKANAVNSPIQSCSGKTQYATRQIY